MKKEYIRPKMEEMLLECQQQILSASNFTPGSGDDYKGDDAGGTGRRGTWGNLWAEE
ncbi:MAG: hypothetical protein J6S11_06655 [Bacteroidaceae bacterium]|nr:hypothetical protein [Bacteroidaceae bacterium]